MILFNLQHGQIMLAIGSYKSPNILPKCLYFCLVDPKSTYIFTSEVCLFLKASGEDAFHHIKGSLRWEEESALRILQQTMDVVNQGNWSLSIKLRLEGFVIVA